MANIDSVLYRFLVEESNMPVDKFRILTEDMKSQTVIQIANEVLGSIKEKMQFVDTVCIDKSRGDIKNFQDLETIQSVVMRLSNLARSISDSVNPQLTVYIQEIAKSISNLSKYAPQFRDAYRQKKTIVILQYQSVLLSIVSALSYLVSVAVDFKEGHIRLKDNINIEEILPIKSLIDFNKSVANGSFNTIIKDTSLLREYYVEHKLDDMQIVYEAVDIVNLLNSGIDSFSRLFNDPNRNGTIFKVLGVVMAILAVRDIFYTVANSRSQIMDKINSLKSFLSVDSGKSPSAITKMITANNKEANEIKYCSDAAKKEISTENKEIIMAAKEKPTEVDAYLPEINTDIQPQQPITNLFSDFNF